MADTVESFVPVICHAEQTDLLDLHGQKKVVESIDGTEVGFPSTKYRYVFRWAVLEDGGVIGHNESPRSGSSFPVLGRKAVENYYRNHPRAPRPKAIT